MELVRQKNVATYILVPMLKKDGTIITGLTGLDATFNYYEDGTAPQSSFPSLTNTPAEVGTSGRCYLAITAAEINHGYIHIIITCTNTDAVPQEIIIRTMVGDPLNAAVHANGRELGVSADGYASADVYHMQADVITASAIDDDAEYTLAEIADAIHDEVIEGTYTFRQLIRIFTSILTGKLTITDNEDGTHTYSFRDIADSKNRIVDVINDTTGNRAVPTTFDGV